MRHLIKRSAILIIAAGCVAAVATTFDWHTVGKALAHMHVGQFIAMSVPLLLAIFALRGLRWLIVLGLRPDRVRFMQSFCANGVAAGLAAFTPFQLGEIMKIKLIPKSENRPWSFGLSAFFCERVMDLGGVVGMGMAGLAAHMGYPIAGSLLVTLPIFFAAILAWIVANGARWIPARMQMYLSAMHHPRRLFVASALSTLIWLLYATLWWVAGDAMNVHMTIPQTAMLLGGVMLAVVASMTPGGIGVSELGSRGILMWLGMDQSQAETVAIALRMLTPLFGIAGIACALPLLRQKFAKRLASAG